MFVHIGNNYIIDSKNVIGMFDFETLDTGKNFEKIFKQLKESNNIIDISQGKLKTLIITVEEGVTKGYISNISAVTLGNRIEKLKK